MRLFVMKASLSRHPLRSILLGLGVLVGIAVAAVGAVIGLVLLAVGAVVFTLARLVRGGLGAMTSPRRAGGEIIEGEFRVVEQRPSALRRSFTQAG